jgi:hypothetical protein
MIEIHFTFDWPFIVAEQPAPEAAASERDEAAYRSSQYHHIDVIGVFQLQLC